MPILANSVRRVPPKSFLTTGLAGVALLSILTAGCIQHQDILAVTPTPTPAWAFPSVSPDGSVQCWPRRTPLDQCRWKL